MFKRRVEMHQSEMFAELEAAKQYAESANKSTVRYRAFLSNLRAFNKQRRYLDVGAGTGTLAAVIAQNDPDIEIMALELSSDMVAFGEQYIRSLGLQDQIKFITSDLFNGVLPKVGLAIVNLPYVPSAKLKGLPVYRTEPHQALDGGPDGLSYIRRFLKSVPGVINPGGLVLVELDEDRGKDALILAEDMLPEADIQLIQDLSGQDRYLRLDIP